MSHLYEDAAGHIREKIDRGEYPLGSRIPPENDLAQALGISRPTLRQALDLLAREGLLTRVKGSGTFVSQPKLMHESTSFITSYKEEAMKNRRVLRTQVLALYQAEPDAAAALALKLKSWDKVTVLTRTRTLEGLYGGAPVVYTTVSVPCKLFPDMLSVDFSDASFYEVLAQRGLKVARTLKTLEAVPPAVDVASYLRISAFEPVIRIVSTGLSASGTAIEYSESYYPASRSSFRIDVRE